MENVQNAAHLVLEVTEMSKNQSVNFSVKVSTKDVNDLPSCASFDYALSRVVINGDHLCVLEYYTRESKYIVETR